VCQAPSNRGVDACASWPRRRKALAESTAEETRANTPGARRSCLATVQLSVVHLVRTALRYTSNSDLRP
jgi:hypothetical protein